MRRPVTLSWLNLLCTFVVTLSLFGSAGVAQIETTAVRAQSSISAASQVSAQTFAATVPDGGSRVIRSDKPLTPGVQPVSLSPTVSIPRAGLSGLRQFPSPRSVVTPSIGITLVGIVELRL